MKCYTGVGSRETPEPICQLMMSVARKLDHAGWTLRSGAAPGADTAFEMAAGRREVYIPWRGFHGHFAEHDGSVRVLGDSAYCDEAMRVASTIHPAWEKCSLAARKLHARNVFQVLGHDLRSPSKFVICWTAQGRLVGGTALAIRLARAESIEVFNLALDPDRRRIERWLGEQRRAA